MFAPLQGTIWAGRLMESNQPKAVRAFLLLVLSLPHKLLQNTPKPFSKIYDGRELGVHDVAKLPMLRREDLNTQDIVMIAFSVQRVRNPRIVGSTYKLPWTTWEVELCLQRIVLIVSYSEEAEDANKPSGDK